MADVEIRLTETVKKGGCAAKLPAGQLREVLGKLVMKRRPELLVGTETMDDACLWDLGQGELLIQTLDFFTPIVDDAEDFGAIAAANALSDVYAMGGAPFTALAILAFPSSTLPFALLEPLMRGAIEKIQEAGAVLGGGHSIDDETLKLGFSVAGRVGKGAEWTNAGARPGDAVILTKALGTGTITTALKIREARAEWVSAAIESMKLLNRAPELLTGVDVHAATDITGFGLAGHALQMARASGVKIRIDVAQLPALLGAEESLKDENLNRAHKTNADYVADSVDYAASVEAWQRWLTVDPQTSGGLLLLIPEAQVAETLDRLRGRFPRVARIGSVVGADSSGRVEFR